MRADLLRLNGFVKDKVLTGPKYVTVHLTSRCNYGCFYCIHHSRMISSDRRAKKFDLDFEVFKGVIDDCQALNAERMVFSGRGEPFLHEHVYDMIDYVKAKGITLSILTNGTFEKKRIRSVCKVDDLKINLNSLREDVFQKTQYGTRENHRRVLENFRILADIKRMQGFPKVRLLFLLNKLNAGEIGDVMDLAKKYSVDFVEFGLPGLTREMKGLAVGPDEMAQLRSRLEDIIGGGDPFLEKTNLKFLYDHMSTTAADHQAATGYDNVVYYEQEFGEKFQCSAGWYYAIIGKDGNVYPCCQYNDAFVAGNIYENSFKEIWLGKKFAEIRAKMKYSHNIKDPFWQRCHNCSWTPFLREVLDRARDSPMAGV